MVRSHPDLVIQCSGALSHAVAVAKKYCVSIPQRGFARGDPFENDHAKRELSKLRADAIARTLRNHGAWTSVLSASKLRSLSNAPTPAVPESQVSNKILSYGFGSALGTGLAAALDFLTASEGDAEEDEFRTFDLLSFS